MLVLGIESSCDETAASVVKDGQTILSNVVSSQVKIHTRYGGVVPELASRAHVKNIIPVLRQSLDDAEVTLNDLDAIAVTLGPGLIGSLLVGVETAKAISYISNLPLITLNHLAGHLYTPFLDESTLGNQSERVLRKGTFDYPYLGLVVSGGHTSLVIVREAGEYEVIGETLDDAAGEAFDKVAKLLELGYPGGPIIDNYAKRCPEPTIRFPRPLLRGKNLNFSYSGLKTAVLTYVKKKGIDKIKSNPAQIAEICAAFQQAVVETLIKKAALALEAHNLNTLAIVGGVAANQGLRQAVKTHFPTTNYHIPSPTLCTDNAAMIAGLAAQVYVPRTRTTPPDFSVNADTGMRLG